LPRHPAVEGEAEQGWDLRGMRDQRSHDRLKVDTAIGARRHQRSRRQCAVRGVGDDPECSERNAVFDGDPRCHMRLHVHRNRTGLFVKTSLCRR